MNENRDHDTGKSNYDSNGENDVHTYQDKPAEPSKTYEGRTTEQHLQRLTIQPQVIILQPGLAECAKPLK